MKIGTNPSNLKTELIAGLTTFFTMAYIVVVNPSILSTEGTGMPFSGVLTATVLVCFLFTLLMGLYAKLPYACAPGMGINAFFTFTLILGKGIPWQTALGMVFWTGVLAVIISATPLREIIARAIPHHLRIAIAAGIGIFLTFIGLKNAGLITANPATFVQFGKLDISSLLFFLGLIVSLWLTHRKNPLAFLAGMATSAAGGWALGLVTVPDQITASPDFSSVFLKADIWGALSLSLLPSIASLLFVDFFDSISTFVGVSQATGLLDEKGEPKNLRKALIADSFATLGSGLAGTSAATTYIESAAGIEAGGRTGMTSVFTALCFLPCLFLAPLAGAIPAYATAPVLVLIGALMFQSVTQLDLSRLEKAIPAYLTIILIPLTFSITQGILWGFISYAGLHLLTGRGREISTPLYVLSVISVGLLFLEHAG